MTNDRKFRFGVQVGSTGSGAEWRDLARKVEDLGYSTLLVPDHFAGYQLAPMPAIAYAAAAGVVVLRAASLGHPWLAVTANGLGGLIPH